MSSYCIIIANRSESCERVDIMGTIVVDASPFLYPFIIEYSLISAAVLYVMWKNIGKNPVFQVSGETARYNYLHFKTFKYMLFFYSIRGAMLDVKNYP